MGDADAERVMNVKRAEAAWFLRWVRQQRRDEGTRGGPSPGWEADALARAAQLLADHYGLER